MQTEDGYIINKCLEGDTAAYGILVDRYKASVYALAYSRLGNFSDAEDVAQDVFIKAYKNLRTLRRWDSFHIWLYSITINICKMRLRTRSKRPDREFVEDLKPETLERQSVDSYREKLAFDSLREALDSLSEIHRQVLTLHYLGGMNIREVAEALGRSTRTIDRWLQSARSQLKEEMLAMMDTTYDRQKLQAVFTLRIFEAIKRIGQNPITPIKSLPFGLSLATGLIIAILGVSTYINPFNDTERLMASMGEPKVLSIGEFPVELMKVSDKYNMLSRGISGNGLGSIVPNLQNALFMAPQAEGKWTKKADMPTARMCLSPTAGIVNDKLYIIGGYSDRYVSTCEEYDPTTDKWKEKSNMPTARGDLSTCAAHGKIYAMGGYDDGQPIEFSIVEEYDPALDKWAKKANMPTGRQFFSANTIGDKIYVIGGWRNAGVLSITEEYDPVEDEWTKKANMPTARYGFSACVANGKIYVIGGCRLGGAPLGNGGAISTMEEYDPKSDKWAKKAEMPTERMFFTTSSVNGKIYAMGGWVNDLGTSNVVEEYDPAIDKWTRKADMPTTRSRFSSGVVNGKIYVFGGSGDANGTIVEEYDPGTGESINLKGKLPATWGEAKIALSK